MSKKILILSGSPRKNGNSDLLYNEFMRGALESGNEVEKIRITEKKVSPCSACYYCRDHGGVCVHKDDMADILQKMVDADVLVLASPVYFYSVNAQLKDSLGLTIMDVQKYMGLATQQAVYHWLNGRSLPSIDNVYALSELFRMPIDKIICGNRGYQPEQRSIYYRLKAYVKYLQLYVEATYEDVSLFSN